MYQKKNIRNLDANRDLRYKGLVEGNRFSEKENEMKKLVAMLMVGTLVFSVTACGSETADTTADVAEEVQEVADDVAETTEEVQEAAEDIKEEVDDTAEEVAETVQTEALALSEHVMTTDTEGCDTFTQIVDKLPKEAGFANAKIGDTDVLLVASGIYDNDGEGTMAAIDAEVFAYDPDGAIVYLGYVECGGTSYPLGVIDGKLVYGGNHFMGYATVADGLSGLNTDEVWVEYDAEGNETYVQFQNEEKVEGTDQDALKTELDARFANLESYEVCQFMTP